MILFLPQLTKNYQTENIIASYDFEEPSNISRCRIKWSVVKSFNVHRKPYVRGKALELFIKHEDME